MSFIVEFHVPAAATFLGGISERLPALSWEMEPVVSADRFDVWFTAGDRHDIEAALAADPAIEEYTSIVETDHKSLYTIDVTTDVEHDIQTIIDNSGTLLSISMAAGIVTMETRFNSRETVRQAYERLTADGRSVEIGRIHESTIDEPDRLTTKQHDALLAAIEQGYFDIPRQISMQELAHELDISHQALSERFRRAYAALVEAELEGAVIGGDDIAVIPAGSPNRPSP